MKLKRIITLLLTAVMLTASAVPIFAEKKTEDVVYVDREKDIVFWVTFDVEEPKIVFIAPNDDKFDPAKKADNTETVRNGNNLYYVVKGAESGQWKMEYDQGKNTEIEVTVHDYTSGLYIEEFTIGEVVDDRIDVTFLVNGNEEGKWYNYRLSAVIDENGMEKELRTDSSRLGDEETETLSLSSLSSYSAYMIKLYVWYTEDDMDIFDMAFSETFSYTNAEADANKQDFALRVLPEDMLLYVSWIEVPWNVESMLIAVFENGDTEPVMFDEYNPHEHSSVQLAYSPDCTEVAVEVTAKVNGINAAPVRKTFDPSDFGISIPQGETFNSLTLPIEYKSLSTQPVVVSVNQNATDLVFDGDGQVNLTLGDDWNDLLISYTTEENITWEINKSIFVDRIAPILEMSRDYDGITVKEETITISGTAKECVTVTINGTEVTLGDSSTFSMDVTLAEGENVITVIASDVAGNESQYTAVIYRGDEPVDHTVEVENEEEDVTGTGADKDSDKDDKTSDGLKDFANNVTSKGNYLVLIVSGSICILVIGYALIFWRKGGKKE